jgi:hypothetical protein
MLYMAYGGSSPDSIGRIWLFLILAIFAAQLMRPSGRSGYSGRR